jgi:hypothetical protein
MRKKALYVRFKGIPEGGLKGLQTKGPISFLQKAGIQAGICTIFDELPHIELFQ